MCTLHKSSQEARVSYGPGCVATNSNFKASTLNIDAGCQVDIVILSFGEEQELQLTISSKSTLVARTRLSVERNFTCVRLDLFSLIPTLF